MTGRLVSVNLGILRTGSWTGDQGSTGIDKRSAPGRVMATALGLAGDHVVDTRHHGGVDQALYAFAQEDARWWAQELSRPVHPGNFGENLTTEGIDVTDAVIGERWVVGSVEVEVSGPRIPCRVFAGFWEVPDLIKRFTARARPGAYLRVVTEGEIGAGDPIERIHTPAHGLTIGTVFRALTTEPELLPLLLDVAELPVKRRDVAARRLGREVAPSPVATAQER